MSNTLKGISEKNKHIIDRVHRIRRFLGRTTLWVIFIANMLSLVLLGISLLAWYTPPYQNIVPSYLGLGFFVLLILNFLFACFWIVILKWKPLIYSALTLAFSWNAIWTYFPVNRETENVPEDCIKLMTYNVMGFNWAIDESARANPIFEYMANSGADIICMQEFVINNNQYNSDGIISISEIDRIMSDYPYRAIWRFGKSYESKYSFGIACYSKFPIVNSEEIPFESETNGAAMYDLRIKDRIVRLVNVHFESNRLTSEDKELYRDFISSGNAHLLPEVSESITEKLGAAYLKRANQVDIVVDWIQEHKEDGYPTILCGDFNDTPISYAYKKILKGAKLKDSFAETGFGQGISYNRNMFWFRIDYIMHSRDIQSYNAMVDRVLHSDHYPLMTYLQLKD